MKIPKKPPKIKEILDKHHPKVFSLLENEQIRNFIIKCNKKYVHWDQLRYKKIPDASNAIAETEAIKIS